MLMFSEQVLHTALDGFVLLVLCPFLYLLSCIRWRRFRDAITQNAGRWWSSLTLIAAFLILLSAVIFASQALTIAPDLEKLLNTPNPSLSADLIRF